VKRAIRVGLKLDNEEKNKFLEDLPSQLRIELSVLIHKDIVHGIEFFENKPPRFLAMIGPMLNFIKIGEGELVVTEGDLAEQMFFIKEGEVSIVLTKFNNFPFMTISSGYFFGEVCYLYIFLQRSTPMMMQYNFTQFIYLIRLIFSFMKRGNFHTKQIQI
jgi:hypothetical protein